MTDDLVAFIRKQLDTDAAEAERLGGAAWTCAVEEPRRWVSGKPGDQARGEVRRDPRETEPEAAGPVYRTPRAVIAVCGISETDSAAARVTHIARHDPARVLREVAAKRRRIEALAEAAERGLYITATYTAEDALRDEAAVYADRPGYKEDWAPIAR